MDTRKLVVGQEVQMVSGPYGDGGKVVKVTPEGVEVSTRVGNKVNWIRTPSGLIEEILHFDTNGKGRDDEGTYERGPWELVDMPFEGRWRKIATAPIFRLLLNALNRKNPKFK